MTRIRPDTSAENAPRDFGVCQKFPNTLRITRNAFAPPKVLDFMKVYQRVTVAVSLIFSLLFVFGCGRDAGQSRANGNLNRPLIEPPAASGRPKIVALGDSLAAGFGLLEKESFTYLLQAKLDADGYQYEVVNAAVSGDTSLGGLERADWVLKNDNVEILILELGGNDLLRRIPVAELKKNLTAIIKKAQARNIRVLLCGMLAPPNVGADYQREFQLVYPDLAAEFKTDFLPFLLDGVALKPELNLPDGIHPNAEGEKIMTDNVYRALQPMLRKTNP
jgi:acyl-CoA thioesterase-1